MDREKLVRAYRGILEAIGEDPEREGLVRTPERAAKAMLTLTGGYEGDADALAVTFSEGYDQMVVLRGVEFYSLCEHHILPFFGTVSIGYVPAEGGKVLGVSKLARMTDLFARRLQVQERLTQQIAQAIEEAVHPKGVAVVVEALHLCMAARGVAKQRARMTTSEMRGVFRDNPAARAEMMALLRDKGVHE